MVEGIISRGDRRLGPVIEDVWRARRHLPGVVRALRPPALGRRHGPPRAVDRLVRPPPPHRARGPALGPPLGRPAQGLPLAGLARRPRRARPGGLPVDPVLRLRGLHRLRHRARGGLGHAARRRQPGHRPGPGRRRPSPTAVPVSLQGEGADAGALPVHQAGQGPLHQPPRRRPGLGAGAAPRRAARGPDRGLHRPGPRSTSGWPCPPAPSRWASTSTSTSASRGRRLDRRRPGRAASARCCPTASTSRRRRSSRPRRPRCSRPSPAAAGPSRRWASSAGAGQAAGRRPAGRARGPGRPASARATTSPTTSGPTSSIWPSSGDVARVPAPSGDRLIAPAGIELDAELATQPRGLRPAELARRPGASRHEGRIRRNHQWITIDGARQEPLLAGATSAARAPAGAP